MSYENLFKVKPMHDLELHQVRKNICPKCKKVLEIATTMGDIRWKQCVGCKRVYVDIRRD